MSAEQYDAEAMLAEYEAWATGEISELTLWQSVPNRTTLRLARQLVNAEAMLAQVRQHRESLLRHCAEIERKFVPSTRWRAVPLLDRAERVGVLKERA